MNGWMSCSFSLMVVSACSSLLRSVLPNGLKTLPQGLCVSVYVCLAMVAPSSIISEEK